jgi:RNA polymerase sigma factor (sigma-70 family)
MELWQDVETWAQTKYCAEWYRDDMLLSIVMEALCLAVQSYPGDGGSLRNWVIACIEHDLLDYLRRRKHEHKHGLSGGTGYFDESRPSSDDETISNMAGELTGIEYKPAERSCPATCREAGPVDNAVASEMIAAVPENLVPYVEARKAGMSLREMAAKFNVSRETVRRRLRKAGKACFSGSFHRGGGGSFLSV